MTSPKLTTDSAMDQPAVRDAVAAWTEDMFAVAGRLLVAQQRLAQTMVTAMMPAFDAVQQVGQRVTEVARETSEQAVDTAQHAVHTAQHAVHTAQQAGHRFTEVARDTTERAASVAQQAGERLIETSRDTVEQVTGAARDNVGTLTDAQRKNVEHAAGEATPKDRGEAGSQVVDQAGEAAKRHAAAKSPAPKENGPLTPKGSASRSARENS